MHQSSCSENIDGIKELKNLNSFDDRGSFQSIFKIQNTALFSIWGNRKVMQINISKTKKIGTIRGLHYQKEPFLEAKLITCLKGKVWDVAVDMRKDSKTYGKWKNVILSSKLNNTFFIPEGFAHGFQCLETNSELLYIHSQKWSKKDETGINYNDNFLNIPWPIGNTFLSKKDIALPYFDINE